MRRKSLNSVKIYYPKFSREHLVHLLRREFERIAEKIPVNLAILFGSYAIDRYTASSDIDLFVVVAGKDKNRYYNEISDQLKMGSLQLHLYTSDEYDKMKIKSMFIKEVEKKGIKIFTKTLNVMDSS